MRFTALVVLGVAALALNGCGTDAGDSGKTGDEETPSRYSEDDPEYRLASIDAQDPNERVPDQTVDRYARLLNKLERYCREDRPMLADRVVNGMKRLKDRKRPEYTNLRVLRAYGNAMSSKLGKNQNCAERFDAVIALTSRDE